MNESRTKARLEKATALHRRGHFDEAKIIYREVLAHDPRNVDALGLLASALRSTGKLDQALELYAEAAALAPELPEFWTNYGNALVEAGRPADAIASFDRALGSDPLHVNAWTHKAIELARLGRETEAIECYRRSLSIEPRQQNALNNLANLLSDTGSHSEAASYLREVTRYWPELAEGHYNLALVLLRMGDFFQGFAEYEWRWQTGHAFSKPAYGDIPSWHGESLTGKRLIVHGEQGMGDMIQFSRLLGLASSLGGSVVLHVPEKLERLMKTLPFPIEVASGLKPESADYQVPLMSLPRALKLTPGSLPRLARHLQPEHSLVEKWRQKLALKRGGKTIGVVWQGNPHSPAEKGRSLSSPQHLRPFAELPNARIIALQMLEPAMLEPAETPSGWRVAGLDYTLEHPGPEFDRGPDAFVDTAAVMQELDVVVSVCTAPLHLAGALGRPAIGLLKAVADWRWLTDRWTTPWYPAMKLVRQKPGEHDFEEVISRAVRLVSGLH